MFVALTMIEKKQLLSITFLKMYGSNNGTAKYNVYNETIPESELRNDKSVLFKNN